MKFIFNRKILILIGIKLLLFYGIHKVYRKYSSEWERCKANSAIIIEDSFSDLPREKIINDAIFFIETTNSTDHQLTARQACAIESAAYVNPNKEIIVLFLTASNYIRLRHWPHFKHLLKYKNIHLRYFNINDLTAETPFEEWIETGYVSNSPYQTSHLSDILRYAVLYKYSGLYLDLDVITIKPIDSIKHKNFACLEENRKRFQSINGAVLRVSDQNGRELIHMMIDQVIKTYDSRKHWDIGPRLVTKVLKEYCEIDDFLKTTECKNFKILPIEKCYAIEGYEWYKFYRESDTKLVLKSTKDSYYIHLWNYQSSKNKISKSKNVAFNVLASKYCPLVYENNDEL
ncbi:hypothetical protein ACKWTF_000970 [Chironomus riparius]